MAGFDNDDNFPGDDLEEVRIKDRNHTFTVLVICWLCLLTIFVFIHEVFLHNFYDHLKIIEKAIGK